MFLQIIIGLGTSFIGSVLGLVVALRYDLAGMWEQKHIERGRKMEERKMEEKRLGN